MTRNALNTLLEVGNTDALIYSSNVENTPVKRSWKYNNCCKKVTLHVHHMLQTKKKNIQVLILVARVLTGVIEVIFCGLTTLSGFGSMDNPCQTYKLESMTTFLSLKEFFF